MIHKPGDLPSLFSGGFGRGALRPFGAGITSSTSGFPPVSPERQHLSDARDAPRERWVRDQNDNQARLMDRPTSIYVCITCRNANEPLEPRDQRAGARLFAILEAHPARADPTLRLIPVECLSVCKRPCTVSFAAPGKWTYVYGDLPHATSAETIFSGAKLHAAASDGLIPWPQRPEALKRGVIARIPPLIVATDLLHLENKT
jgi:predicted metal-binding protein